LKSAVSFIGYETFLVAPGLVDESQLQGHILPTAEGEEYAANAIRLRQHLLIADGYPATRKRLARFAEDHQVTLVALDVSEFRKGGGSLTCLSLLW
jgi:N-dimethylarginine dimethylaminohydrolase